MAKVVLPRVQAMLLCDDVERPPDEEGVYNLLGVRTQIEARSFPHIQRQVCVYLQVSGHPGTVSGVVLAVNARTDQELFRRATRSITLTGPLAIVPVIVRMRNCEFPEAGIYYFQTYFGEKLVYERPLHVIENREIGNGQE